MQGGRVSVKTRIRYAASVSHVELVYLNREDSSYRFSIVKELTDSDNNRRERDQPLDFSGTVPEDQVPGPYFCEQIIVRTSGGNELEAAGAPKDSFGVMVTEARDPQAAGWEMRTE